MRLTDERWRHITTGHPEMAVYFDEILGAIEKPQIIYEGTLGALIAVRNCDEITSSFFLIP